MSPKKRKSKQQTISRREFLAKMSLVGAGVLAGGIGATQLARYFLPDAALTADSAAYFLTAQDIQNWRAQTDDRALISASDEMLRLLEQGYRTQIPYHPDSSYQVERRFGETALGIGLVSFATDDMRFAEGSYSVRQETLGTLSDQTPFVIPLTAQERRVQVADAAKRPLLLTGDSFAQGIGVHYDDSLAGRIGRRKHINLAVAGHGTEDQVRRLQQYLTLFDGDQVLAGKTVLHVIHPNDILNDLLTNFYWHFYNQMPRSYYADFIPRFTELMQSAREHRHSGLGLYALDPVRLREIGTIDIAPYQYNVAKARFVPQLNFNGLAAHPIICDSDMRYVPLTLDQIAAEYGLTAAALVDDDDFSTEIKLRYADSGALIATGYHRLGGFDPLALTIRRLTQLRDAVVAQGGTFIAFRAGTFEEYAYQHRDFEGALRAVFGADMPAMDDPADFRHRYLSRARAAGITVYDLAPPTIAGAHTLTTLGKYPYYLTDTHFNPIGHLLTAGLILARLRDDHPQLYRQLA